MQPPQLLPGDINAEVLLSYYPLGTVKLAMQGMHKRNSYGDIIDLEPMGPEAMRLTEEEGYTYIPPFNDLTVATGQGTIADNGDHLMHPLSRQRIDLHYPVKVLFFRPPDRQFFHALTLLQSQHAKGSSSGSSRSLPTLPPASRDHCRGHTAFRHCTHR